MPPATQAQTPEPPLDPREVKIALVHREWTQAELARRVGKSLTATNLAINHNTYPDITRRIRKILSL